VKSEVSEKKVTKVNVRTLSKFAGKKVKLELKSGFYFVGEIKSIIETDVLFIDKHDNEMAISSEDVSTVRIAKD
jgi:hypothetical protein